MKRVTVNAIVDLGCIITFIPSLLTGVVLYLFLPSGGGRGSSWSTWMGITRHEWILWHDVASFALAVLIVIHLLLHWKFFKTITMVPGPQVKDECAAES